MRRLHRKLGPGMPRARYVIDALGAGVRRGRFDGDVRSQPRWSRNLATAIARHGQMPGLPNFDVAVKTADVSRACRFCRIVMHRFMNENWG